MELTIARQDLLRELSAAQSVVERKSTIPILSNILLTANENHTVTVTATDLDQSMRSSCPAKVKTPGCAAIPARKLYDYVKLLGDVDINIKLLENNWIQLRAGRSHTKMVAMAATNFPQIPVFPDASAIRLPAIAMKAMIGKTSFAISTEESRYTLNGALFSIKPQSIAMVSTDGHRLAFIDVNTTIAGLTAEKRTLIPRKALMELQTLLGSSENEQFEFADDESTLFFRFAGRVLTSRKLTGQFPNYEAVLPKENGKIAVVRTRELASAIMRVGQFTDERSNTIRMKLEKNELKITGFSTEIGESEETIDTAYTQEPLLVAFNANYVRDFLRAVGDTESVKLKFKDGNSAGEFIPEQAIPDTTYRCIVMPCRS